MLAAVLLLLPLLSAAASSHLAHRHGNNGHSHTAEKRLPSTWYHDAAHPVHELFRRGAPTDGATYPVVGSDEWAKAYPPGPPASPDVTKLPTEWVDALNAAVARGAIPNIPPSTSSDGNNPVYPNRLDPNGPEVCSSTEKCRIDGDIWDAPAGYVGISFDDGPEAGTETLLTFLDQKKQQVTHFMIGSNLIFQPNDFLAAFNRGDDIAVHTWTHPQMTTKNNLEVVAELGWTMKIIHDSTGGRVPKFWRPPYGDSDKRVTAIAKEVFGLTTIIWNQDTEDWSLTNTPPGTSPAKIKASMQQWLTGPKSPGLIILEHELSVDSVNSFIAAYPVMQQNNWQLVSLAQLMGGNASYFNADNSGSPVSGVLDIVAANGTTSSGSSASASPSGSSGSKNSTSSNNANAPAKGGPSATSAGASASQSASGKSSAAARWAAAPTTLLGGAAIVLLALWN
ncbi:chitin deacetylase [Mycena alexandri]|uniref:chitin deacetylase n=1 Tax=Mycena alexandri TaxID=1745969 RepID=A0AAD6SRR3_9AGAR|nr:chitin deacetylase [Mycena alexandri]